MNKLYFGDNLEILREMPDERVHLICTDPPFNSGRDYNTFLGDSLAQKRAFTDTWTWDTAAQDTRADIEQRAISSDTYKALDTCLKGYDFVLQNAVSGNKGAMRAYLAFMGPPDTIPERIGSLILFILNSCFWQISVDCCPLTAINNSLSVFFLTFVCFCRIMPTALTHLAI